MAGLADFLSSALTVGTKAAGAHEAGVGARRKAETADLLDQIKLARQKQQDALTAQLRDAQLRNIDSQITTREAPPPPPAPRNVDRLSDEGMDRSVELAKRLQAIKPRGEASSGAGPRGGPQETRDKARIAGWAAATIKAGESNPDRLVSAALAMNRGVDPQIVSAAVYEALLKAEEAP